MSREHVPERLRALGATDLERRILEAAAHEQPSPEMRERMAQAIGIPLAAIACTALETAVGKGAAATKAAASAGASTTGIPVLSWISLSVAALVIAGAVVGTRVWRRTTATPPSTPVAALVPVGVEPMVTAPTPVAPTTIAPNTAVEPPRGTVATPRPRRNQAGTAATDLRDQIALVDGARAAVSAGDGERALRILLQYEERFPNGSFRPEAAALRIEALVKLGRSSEARALAQRFAAEYGRSPLAERVARVAGLPRR